MDTLDRVLTKVEAIREDQVRSIEVLGEVRHLLRTQPIPSEPATQPTPAPVAVEIPWAAKILPWLTTSTMWLLRAFWKHLPTIGAVIYMKATGQDEKILAYLNATLFGM